MASLGIGSFMRGLAGGMELRNRQEDREYRREQDALDREDRMFERQRRVSREDEQRALDMEDRKQRNADRASDRAWQNEARDRQRQDWKRADVVTGSFAQAADEASAARNADVDAAVKPIEANGPTPEGKGLPAYQVGDATYTDKGQARAAAEKDVKPFMDYYTQKSAPLVTEAYMRAGQPEKAQAYNAWLKTEGVQRGMESWAKALQAASRDDADAFAKHITDAYNQQGYFEDGRTTTAKLRKDKDGNTVGMDLEFEDKATGKKWTRSLEGRQDIYHMGIELMAPEQVFKFGMQQIEAADKARADIAKDKRAEARETGKMMLEAALKEAERQGPQGAIEFRKRLDSTMKSLLANDMGYARLSSDDKVAKAIEVLRAQDRGVASAGYAGGDGQGRGVAVPPTLGNPGAGTRALPVAPGASGGERGIPVWTPERAPQPAPAAAKPDRGEPAPEATEPEPVPEQREDEPALPSRAAPTSAPEPDEPSVSWRKIYLGHGRKVVGSLAHAGARGIRGIEDLRERDLEADEPLDAYGDRMTQAGDALLEHERENAKAVARANSARAKLHSDMLERRDRIRREAAERKTREREDALRGVREKQEEAERRYREKRGLPAYPGN